MDSDKLIWLRNLLHECGIMADEIPDDALSDAYQTIVSDVAEAVILQTDYRYTITGSPGAPIPPNQCLPSIADISQAAGCSAMDIHRVDYDAVGAVVVTKDSRRIRISHSEINRAISHSYETMP